MTYWIDRFLDKADAMIALFLVLSFMDYLLKLRSIRLHPVLYALVIAVLGYCIFGIF